MKNIFIEGIQGNGKTTLLRLLGQALPDYHVYWEGDYSPVELAWCTYMTESEYEAALAKFPDLAEKIRQATHQEDSHYIVTYTRILAERREFYEYMEQYEIYNGRRPLEEFKAILLRRYENFSGAGNVFECSFFQNTMEELLLYYDMTEQEILDFYVELFAKLKEKKFVMVYLRSEQIEENILQIKKERSDENGVEMWYPLMLRYLNDTPYGKKHPFEGVADMAAHFRRRMKMELVAIEKVLGNQAIVIPAKEYQIEELIRQIQGGEIMNEKIEVRIIDKAHSADINIPNQPFELFGRMIPSYVNEQWSYTTELFPEVSTMCFPDENYDFDTLSENSVFIGAYDGEKCIGLAIMQQEWFKYMYLYDLKVNPDYRGKNVGAMLIEKAKEVAKENGYLGIHTVGQDNNLAACKFYIKSGFAIGGLDTKVYQGTKQEGKKDILFYLDI